MEILIYLGIFYGGVLGGFLLRNWLQMRAGYNGVIVVIKEPDRTVYSLILDDDPEKIELSKKVILKVIPPKEESDRD